MTTRRKDKQNDTWHCSIVLTKCTGYGEGDDALDEGVVKSLEDDLTCSKGIELP